MKRFYTAPIRAYQFVSRMLPANCRYYPTCSEYAIWQFETNAPHKAFVASGARILRCNQFFAGGIDYPKIRYNVPSRRPMLLAANPTKSKIPIKYWLVPTNKKHFVIKDIHETHTP